MNRQHVGATIEVIKQSIRNGESQEALYLLESFKGVLAEATERMEEEEGDREARQLHDGVRALGFPTTPIQATNNVTTRRSARGNVNDNNRVTPNGKIIDYETVKQREKDYAKDHKLPFESSYKHNENQSYTMTMKDIYDRFVSADKAYILNIGDTPYNPNNAQSSKAYADEKKALFHGTRSHFEIDQGIVFNWLQGAFKHVYMGIFSTISAEDENCGTRAYEQIERQANPVNFYIRDEMQKQMKDYLKEAIKTTWSQKREQIARLRMDGRKKQADLKPYEIAMYIYKCLEASGEHWKDFLGSQTCIDLKNVREEAFTEETLDKLFKELDTVENNHATITTHKSKGKDDHHGLLSFDEHPKKKHPEKHPCKWHGGRMVAHREDQCRLNPDFGKKTREAPKPEKQA